ncbi:MAG: phosphonopyruvate decarboxylase [Treponema sp.]|nr:phosphonopyruvate decarboxylase [Treponema sp.]MCI6546818.1 phosphonopyruvate decarboxylase [Spirochaetia bacterium]MCI7436191.1 phosphonopyruvate decarboxylase [Spirochaetia bacterium]MDY2826059.1 phosphonopyruvate decarboxylase [Treponema sp.]MDY4767796.1 phosphonopyruvate decarboxylase [Treponema sp.]
MIRPSYFYDLLIKNGTDFFAGVPDSLLKNFCAYVTDNAPSEKHIISANEGSATALACGYHMATGKIPMIYMQNSGEGNMVNPMLSLADRDVYSIPMLIVIGWRGEPGVHDEPQHVKQGKVTCDLLDAMKIPYEVLSENEAELPGQFEKAYKYIKENNAQYAFVIRKNTFDEYKLVNNIPVEGKMSREEAIEKIMLSADDKTAFVSTTGMASRELYELRDKHNQAHDRDFLTVGGMGHCSQIALAIAMNKADRQVYCIDGDGASIMQMGGMATIGTRNPSNMVHFVMNNGAHDSVGGQPTVGRQIDLCAIAAGCGYENVVKVETPEELDAVLHDDETKSKLTFVEVLVTKGARKDLGRPKSTPVQNKEALMEFLK